jgi:hypothetical protein
MLSQNDSNQLPAHATAQKSEDLTYTTAKVWNHIHIFDIFLYYSDSSNTGDYQSEVKMG